MDYIKHSNKENFTKRLAMFSICVYLVFSTVFDSVASGLSVLSSISIYFCLACCFLHLLDKGRFKFRGIEIVLFFLGIFFLISTLYTPTSEDEINMYIYRYWTSLVLIALVANVINTQEDAFKVVDFYILAGVLLSLYMYSIYGFDNLMSATERIDLQLGNQNSTGLRCAFTIIFAIYRAVTRKGEGCSHFYLAAMIVCLPAIMFTGSRKAILVVAVALFVFMLTYSKNKMLLSRVIVACAGVAVIFCIVHYIPAFQPIEDRFSSFFDVLQGDKSAETSISDNNRIYYIKEGLRLFWESPLWGKGFFSSFYFFDAYTHNNYVELLLNGGIIAFTIYYSVYVAVLASAVKTLKKKANRAYDCLQIMIIVAMMVIDIGVPSFLERYTLLMFTLCMCKKTSSENNSLE